MRCTIKRKVSRDNVAFIKLIKEPNSNKSFRRLKGTRSDLRLLYISLTEELIKSKILDEQDFIAIFTYLNNHINLGGAR